MHFYFIKTIFIKQKGVSMLLLWFLVGYVLMAVHGSVIFLDCGSAYDLESVEISGCGMRLPCYITLGEDVLVRLKFYADFASSKLNQSVVIQMNYINNAVTKVTPEPCDIVVCPVKTSCETSFTSVMSVPRRMALNERGWLQWKVYNEKGVLVLCYSVLVETQSPQQKLQRQNTTNIDD